MIEAETHRDLLESKVIIDAGADRVWHVLSDVIRWPQWLPTVSRVVPLDGEAIAVGARYLIHQPRLRPAVWTVTDLQDFQRFVWEARFTGLRMTAEHAVSEKAPDVSEVILRFSFGGPLGGIVGGLFRPIARRYLAQEAAALKHAVEEGLSSQPDEHLRHRHAR